MSSIEYAERVWVYGATWERYQTLVDLFAELHVRLGYDGWSLEMAKSTPLHERRKVRLGAVIDELAMGHGVALSALGGATVHREDLKRGIDPDLSYYRPGKLKRTGRDLDVEGPPDLVVEVHATDSSPWRLSLLGDLGVAEAWDFGGRRLRVSILEGGSLVASDRSRLFPLAPIEALGELLREPDEGSDIAWRERVRELASSLQTAREG